MPHQSTAKEPGRYAALAPNRKSTLRILRQITITFVSIVAIARLGFPSGFSIPRKTATYHQHQYRSIMISLSNAFDAVIVGGGPAGSVTAILLARLGWSVALIEKGDRFRNKCCGGCLSARAAADLHSLDLLHSLDAAKLFPTDSVRIHLASSSSRDRTFRFSTSSRAALYSRAIMDQSLTDVAASLGVRVFQPCSAHAFARQDHGWKVTLRAQSHESMRIISARLLIGADGLGSRVARSAGLQIAEKSAHRSRSYGFSVDLPKSLIPALHGLDDNCVEMFVLDDGYVGIVKSDEQRGGHLGALVHRNCAKMARNPAEYLAFGATRCPSLHALKTLSSDLMRTKSFSAVGPMPWSVRAIASKNLALVGDAAGYVEPFTGEGIAWAIRSAKCLAEAAAEAPMRTWNSRTCAVYQQLWRSHIRSRHHVCKAVTSAVQRPMLANTILRAANAFPRVASHVIHHLVLSERTAEIPS
ncbi:MAG TPA: NAD(P)/FAD-dependent oxidoreductase [Phycisphaerales bacterium]|nr:NAD(P)/FAD-dependent oxidoreductase [Phycisphaerales bacterium]